MNTALSIILFIVYILAAVFFTLFIIHLVYDNIEERKRQAELIEDIRDQILDLRTHITLKDASLDDIKRTLKQLDK